MKNMDYVLKDGTVIEVDIKESKLPDMDIFKLSGQELEQYCVDLFTRLGWKVKKEDVLSVETGNFRADMIIGDGKKDYGFVEVISANSINSVIEKKEQLQCIIDKCKPEICILTNGLVFDIFYKGTYTGTQTTPPTLEDVNRMNRLMAYYNALNNISEG